MAIGTFAGAYAPISRRRHRVQSATSLAFFSSHAAAHIEKDNNSARRQVVSGINDRFAVQAHENILLGEITNGVLEPPPPSSRICVSLLRAIALSFSLDFRKRSEYLCNPRARLGVGLSVLVL